jgi:predicted RNase H-like HicB family nuclease
MFRKKQKSELVLNGVLIQNPSGRFTAYFEEFPDIIAEGNDEPEAKKNLVEALIMVAQFKVKQRLAKLDDTAACLEVGSESGKQQIKHFHQKFGQLAY